MRRGGKRLAFKEEPHPLLEPFLKEFAHHAIPGGVVQLRRQHLFKPQHHPAVAGLEGFEQLAGAAAAQAAHQGVVAGRQGDGADPAEAHAFGPLGMERGEAVEIGFPFGDLVVELGGEVFAVDPEQGIDHLIELALALQEAHLHLVAPTAAHQALEAPLLGGEDAQIVVGQAALLEPGGYLVVAGDAPALEEDRHQGLFLLGGHRDGVYQLVEQPGTGQGAGLVLLPDEAVELREGQPGATRGQLHHGCLTQAGEGFGQGVPLGAPGAHGAGMRRGSWRRVRASAIRPRPLSRLQVVRA